MRHTLTQQSITKLSSVEGIADTSPTGVITVAIVAGTATRDKHFSNWKGHQTLFTVRVVTSGTASTVQPNTVTV